jgi:hypothetical protein
MRNLLIFIVGLILVIGFVFLMKTQSQSTFIQDTEKEMFQMKCQKDSLFKIADEVTQFTDKLKHQNDSLIHIKPKQNLKIIEKIIRDTIIEEAPVIKSMALERYDDSGEVQRLNDELNMTRGFLFRLSAERDTLVYRLEMLQNEIDSLKKLK